MSILIDKSTRLLVQGNHRQGWTFSCQKDG